jgi:exosome complex RNA-binding protein Csl4
MSPQPPSKPELLYCPKCAVEVSDPLTCGDCGAVICRKCGTPLEAADELGMG